MKYDFITIGGAAEDLTLLVKEGILIDNKKDILRQKLLAFEYGAKIEIDDIDRNFGGGAANVAVSLSGLGFRVANISAVGRDERGDRILKNFRKHRIDSRLIRVTGEEETSYSFIILGKSKDRVIFFSRGAEKKIEITKKELKYLNKTRWIYLNALSGDWKENLKKIFSVEKAKIIWNPGNAQLERGKELKKYLVRTEILIVNKDEAIQLAISAGAAAGRGNVFLNNIDNLLRTLKALGPKVVVITNGKAGAKAYDGKHIYFQGVLKEKVRLDTTGLGDAFGSAFAAGMIFYKGNLRRSLLLGARNSASVISEIGAQKGLLTKEKIFFYL